MTDAPADPDTTPEQYVSKQKMPEHYHDLFQLYSELEDEVQSLIKASGPDISKVTRAQRRVIVRSVFALIEAIVYSIKNIAANKTGVILSQADKMTASEINYELSDSGKIFVRPSKLRLVGNIRYAFRLFKENFGISSDLDVAGSGWQSFLRSIKVRDRLAHPKRPPDVTVSDLELVEVVEVLDWFRGNFARVMQEALGSVKAETEKYKEQIAALRTQTAATTWTSKDKGTEVFFGSWYP